MDVYVVKFKIHYYAPVPIISHLSSHFQNEDA